ncbi:MAG: alpha-galactosidase [Rhodobacteraceae bacterium]|nr:alpha-galactosidase [Paracoccaceae bacterium]
MSLWELRGDRQSLVFADLDGGMPQIIHWGAPIPPADLPVLADAMRPDITGGMLDAVAPLSICPAAERTFPGQPGMEVAAVDGTPLRPRFKLVDVTGVDRSDADVWLLRCEDRELGLDYMAELALQHASGVISMWSSLSSRQPVRLRWLSAPVLPGPQHADEMIDYAGSWIGEFQPQRTAWQPGIRLRENLTGRTGHEHFPALVIPGRATSNAQGEAWGAHYGWSGGHRMVAEELPDGRRQIQFGHASGSWHEPDTDFATAPLYLAYGAQGLNSMAAMFQTHLRDQIVPWPDPDRPRPVHYNCWEAVYFRHDLTELKDIATRAAALGAERFVLDDGWFGRRDDDTTSLGDWQIDPRKHPDGFGPLIDHIHSLGMRFGLWFEPEMVNLDSDLARAHPDWVLGPADQIEGRGQRVLDLARAEVRKHLFGQISAILSAYDVDYIKWDHNRVLPYPGAAQATGFYTLLDQLRVAFPDLEIESCASGGGRIDFGVLSRAHRVWLSDSNDALERLRMQHEAALFLPWEVTGSHVGPRVCHTSGRVLDIRLRAWVAAQRHMGFEMDPRELTQDEVEVLTRVTAWWKDSCTWRAGAAIARLDSADPAMTAEQQTARDGSRFVVFAGQAESSAQIAPRPLRLTGLDPKARYRVDLINRDDISGLSRGTPALKSGPITLSGQSLMQVGLSLPYTLPASIWVMEGQRL